MSPEMPQEVKETTAAEDCEQPADKIEVAVEHKLQSSQPASKKRGYD